MLTHSVNSNSTTLKDIYLNQELRTIMNGIGRDIRRAGYWKNANGIESNPYSTIFINEKTDCILYSYDTEPNENRIIGNEDNYGIRLIDQAIRVREKSSNCNTRKYWRSISDNKSIRINKLEFQPNHLCNNITDATRSCDITKPGDILAVKYIINITLSGYLINNNENTLTLRDKVIIQNSSTRLVTEG